jgi:hypothetical protein
MVISDFHVFRTCIHPMKADMPLSIHMNAVLTGEIACDSFKVIPGRHLLC